MLNNSLATRIAEYRAAAAAVPETAPDDIMDAATDAQFYAFEAVCHSPSVSMADVAAKLALASEIVVTDPAWARRLVEKAVEETRVLEEEVA